jgi:hypothetical protein
MSNGKKIDRPDEPFVDRGFPIKSTFFNPGKGESLPGPKPEIINAPEKNNYYEELEQAKSRSKDM